LADAAAAAKSHPRGKSAAIAEDSVHPVSHFHGEISLLAREKSLFERDSERASGL